MKQCSTKSIKKSALLEVSKEGIQYKIARDVKNAIAKESPLHGLVIDALIARGEWMVVDE